MFELRVEEGRLSERYNHFKEFEFLHCQATKTRLMGVIALKITWKGLENPRDRYYQVIHLDYSEYGFDEYLEFDCTKGIDDEEQNKEDMDYYWNHFTSVMGGTIINLRPDIMLKLIETATPLASDSIDREYDDEENREFRQYALMRLEMMKDRLAEEGFTADTTTVQEAIKATSPQSLATCETLNYFIMRLIDKDFDACEYLTTIDRKVLEKHELTKAGIQTLIRSSLKTSDQAVDPPADGTSFPYRCTITTLGRNGYYHSSFVIWLNGDYRKKNPLVTQIEMGSLVKLSEFESAIQVVQKEYITVFDVPDRFLNNFDASLIGPLAGFDPTAVANGWLYTIYNKDNSHVNKSEYRLDDDVFGYALLTIPGQLVLMTHMMTNINTLDNAVAYSFYAPYFKLKGRFLLEKTPVFHTLCQSSGTRFEDLIMPVPEN